MKLAEYLEDLDPKLAGSLERAMAAVRREFEEKLTVTVEETVAAAAAEAAALAPEVPETPGAPATKTAISLEAADELRMAALDIDVATSQSEILEALSRGVLRFASRVAIFVNRGREMHGWSATGFGEVDGRIKQVSLGGDEPFPMTDNLAEGSVALSAGDCVSICDALGAEHPSMGLLMPFVLGNQVVGTVYCDRIGEGTFSISALQLLTYVAGQTLETLPVRKRDSTATLALAGGGTETAEPAPPLPAPHDAAIAAAEKQVDEEAVEPRIEQQLEPASKEPADVHEVDLEEYAMDTVEPPEAEPDLSASPIDTPSYPPPAISAPPAEPQPTIDEEGTRPGALIPEPLPIADEPPTPAPEQPTEPLDEPAPTPKEPTLGLGSTQVAPPNDLQGPGWAFASTSGESSGASSESDHEEAQRLARLLVTEIKLYNEEAVEEGRRDANIYSRLQEDIDRSRQIFEDRIDPEVRNENDYFRQALVRILGGGDPSLLGA